MSFHKHGPHTVWWKTRKEKATYLLFLPHPRTTSGSLSYGISSIAHVSRRALDMGSRAASLALACITELKANFPNSVVLSSHTQDFWGRAAGKVLCGGLDLHSSYHWHYQHRNVSGLPVLPLFPIKQLMEEDRWKTDQQLRNTSAHPTYPLADIRPSWPDWALWWKASRKAAPAMAKQLLLTPKSARVTSRLPTAPKYTHKSRRHCPDSFWCHLKGHLQERPGDLQGCQQELPVAPPLKDSSIW